MMKSANNNCTNQNPRPDISLRSFKMDKDGASNVASAATSWSKSETFLFIRKLKEYPCLYNQEDPNYTNKQKRFQKYNLLLAKIKKFKSDITLRSIKRKIRTLRIQLYKERKYSEQFGPDTDEVYKPKLWCSNELSLLFNSTSPPEPNSSYIEPSETQVMENNHASTSNKAGWNREQTLLLLKEVEKYPCLYNPTNKYFANKIKRDDDLNNMLPQIKKFKPDATIDCIKNKIRALQGQLCKEARISRQTLTGPDEVYEPKLWCYNELSFMLQCRDSSNLELSEGSETDEDIDDLVMEQMTSIDFGWTRPQTLSLIRELQKYPCLYNPADSEFKNITMRKAKINLLVAEVKKCKPDVTFPIVKGRIKSLRCQLWKERKRSQKWRDNCEGQEYNPTLWCYNELFFMHDCYNLQPNASTLNTELSKNFSDADSEEDNENSDNQNLSETPGMENYASTSDEPGWNREQTLLFIKELKKYPCLYNPTNNNFANRRKKNEDLNIMLPQVKKFKPDVTIDCIKKKIRVLQGQLCKEARISKQTLTGPDKVYEPKLWCYNELSFMLQCRDSSNLELSEGSETEEDKDDLVMEQKTLVDSGWTRPQTVSLIRELQKYPCLYNPADSEFLNITTRKAKINLLVAKVKKCKPDATFPIVKRKIKTLRGQLCKERKRLQKWRANGEGQEYNPKLWCYNELFFMNDCYTLQQNPSTLTTELCKKSSDAASTKLNNESLCTLKIERQFIEEYSETCSNSSRYNLQQNPSTLTTELCKKSSDAASTKLNNESLCTLKIERQFVEEDFEIRSNSSRSDDEFKMESSINLSNEYCEEENFEDDKEADSEVDKEVDFEDDNEISDIQNISKDEEFCRYLCSQFKRIQLDENLDELKLEILQLVSKKIIEEKRAQQQETYFEIRPVCKTEIDPLTQSACSLSYSTHSMKLPVSKVIENKFNKTTSEIERNKKWSSTSSSSIYSTTIVPPFNSKIGNNLPKRTFMELSDKRFIKEDTTKRKKISSPLKLTEKDPLALDMEHVFVEEYLDY